MDTKMKLDCCISTILYTGYLSSHYMSCITLLMIRLDAGQSILMSVAGLGSELFAVILTPGLPWHYALQHAASSALDVLGQR